MEAILAMLADALTTLSPCVLPLLPFVLASAAQQHRLGPLALTGGIALSFIVLGAGLFGLGAAFAPQRATLRLLTALLMLAFGVLLMSTPLQQSFAMAGAQLSRFLNPLLERFAMPGWSGQWLLGMLLGVAWTPCSGPTSGAAIVLETEHGLATLILIPGKTLAQPASAGQTGLFAYARSAGHGYYALVTDTPEATAAVQALIQKRVSWNAMG